MPVSEDFRSGCSNFNYKQRYKNLKRKFRYLIYENECFQEELRKVHRRLLKVNQDKSFLLDRLLQYEKVDDTSSDSDGTISSDSELENFAIKKKRSNTSSFSNVHGFGGLQSQSSTSRHSTSEPCPKRKKPASKSIKASTASIPNIENVVSNATPAISGSISLASSSVNNSAGNIGAAGPMLTPLIKNIKVEPEDESEVTVPLGLGQGDGHMTSEEIERHLESKQTLLDLVPERAPPTVPTEMFSSDLSCIDRLFADD